MEMGTKHTLKRTFFICATLGFFAACGSAKGRTLVVEVKEKIENTESSFHGMKAREEDNGAKRDRVILDLHYNDWVGDRQDVNTGWRSIGYNWNLMYDMPFNKKSTTALGLGLRFGKSVVQHNGLFAMNDSLSSTMLMSTNGLAFNRTNQRFVQSFLELPVELRFRGDVAKSYRVSLGASIGLRLNSYERWREGSNKMREYNHNNALIWRAGVYTRIGYGRWNFYGAYYITPMFNGSLDSKLNTWQAGLSLTIF